MAELNVNRSLKYAGFGLCGLLAFAIFLVLELILFLMIYFTSNTFQYPGGAAGVVVFTYIVTLLLIPICAAPCVFCNQRRLRNRSEALMLMKPETEKLGSLEASADDDLEPNADNVLDKLWMKRKTLAAVVLVGFFVVFLFLEITLMFYSPVDSIFPLEPVSADAFGPSSFKPTGCNVEPVFEATKLFFANSTVDFTNVRVGKSATYFSRNVHMAFIYTGIYICLVSLLRYK